MKAKKFLKNSNYPIVVKADNLALKGVYICKNYMEAETAVEIFDENWKSRKYSY